MPNQSAPGVNATTTRGAFIGSASTGIAIALGQLATGLSLILVARAAGPKLFGQFAVTYALSAALAGLIDFGSSQLATRRLASGEFDFSFSRWLVRRTLLQLPAAVVAIALSVAVVGRDLPTAAGFALGAQALTTAVALGLLGAVRGLASPIRAAYFITSGNVAGLFGTSMAVVFDQDVMTLGAIALTCSWLVTALLAWLSVRQPLRATRHLPGPTNPWEGSSGFGLAGIALTLSGLDVLAIRGVAGSLPAGQVAAVGRWTQPIGLVASSFSQYLFPRMAAAESDHEAGRILRTATPVAWIGLLAAGVTAALAGPLVRVLLGEEFQESTQILRWMAIAVLPSLANQLIFGFLQARRQERFAAQAVAMTVALYFALLIPLASGIGAFSAPLAFGASQCVLLVALVRKTGTMLRVTAAPGPPAGNLR
jgi:O-antigen/teichoic acid export membrane protein